MEECSRTNIAIVITFVMMNMEMHVTAPISLTWTGFRLLEILVKRNCSKGSYETSIHSFIPMSSSSYFPVT